MTGENLHVKPVRACDPRGRSEWLKDLYDLFVPVREEAKAYTEDQIHAAIDEAVTAVRRSRG